MSKWSSEQLLLARILAPNALVIAAIDAELKRRSGK